MAPSEALTGAEAHLRAVGYNIKVRESSLEASNGRDYSTAWCIIFFLLGLVPFIVYWFTRKKNRVMGTAMRGKASITYEGRRGASDAATLMDKLKA